MSSEIISLNEVNKHKTKKSCWMVIHNQVYDVTKFLEEHPGGEDALLEYAGKDGTQAFEDVGHSEDARELLKKFKIGLLPQGERAKDVVKHCCKKCISPKKSSQGRPGSCSSCFPESTRPVSETKSWRTFDGSSRSLKQPKPKSVYKKPPSPKVERRVEAIVVPHESDGSGGGGGGKLKWALLALAGAIVIGVVLKKYMS